MQDEVGGMQCDVQDSNALQCRVMLFRGCDVAMLFYAETRGVVELSAAKR